MSLPLPDRVSQMVASAIIIDSPTSSDGQVEVETVEIDDDTTQRILNHFSSSDGVQISPSDIHVRTIEPSFIRFGQHNSFREAGGDSNAYVVDEETGEIQLIDLNDAFTTTIDNAEVEVITVDADRLLTTVNSTSVTGSQFNYTRNNFTAFPTSTSSFGGACASITGTTSHAKIVPGAASTFSTSTSSPIHRMKSAPALLRNSRRVAATDTVKGNGNSNVPKLSSDPSPKTGDSTNSKSSELQQPTKATQGGSRKTKSTTTPRSKSDKGRLQPQQIKYLIHPSPSGGNESSQPLVIIYQNSEGQQVAEVVGNTSNTDGHLDGDCTSNITYQYQLANDSRPLFLHEGNLSDVGNLTIPVPNKQVKVKKKQSNPKKEPSQSSAKSNSKTSGKPKKSATELKCMEQGCSAVTYNVTDLRKHLTTQHDLHFDIENITFSADKEFKEWREQYERERMISFIYRGGTKKISKNQSVTYMICHRSGHYKPTMSDVNKRQRKMKPQGSCKIGGYCTAGIKLLRNLDNGELKMDICHTHYGHPLDSEAIPHLRVNPALRKIILKKFEEGMNFSDVLAYIHHNPDGLEGLRVIDRRAVRNIYDTWKKPIQNSKKCTTTSEMKSANLNEPTENSRDINNVREKLDLAVKPDVGNLPKNFRISKIAMEETIVAESIALQIAECKDSEKIGPNQAQEDVNGRAFEATEMEAPVLYAADDDLGAHYEVDCPMDDDDSNSSPPLLIAIESIKSLRPEVNSPLTESQNRTRKRKKKGLRNQKKPKYSYRHKSAKTGEPILAGNSTASSSNWTIVPEGSKVVTAISEEDLPVVNMTQIVQDLSDESHEYCAELEYNEMTHESDVDDDSEQMQVRISPQVEATIDRLHNHGESGPTILLYKRIGEINIKYGGFCRAFREDDFCLIIQTPVQRQILQMFPKVIGIEMLDSSKPNYEHDLKLVFISVLDDFREPIPVAWMVTDSVSNRVLNQFFRMLRYHCGELPVKYLMAPKNAEIYKTWIANFSNKPKMLQNEFIVRRDLRSLLNRHFPNDNVRRMAWNVIEGMIYEHYVNNLKGLKEVLVKTISSSQNSNTFMKKFEKDWLSRIEEWSFAHRVGATENLLFVANGFTKLKKFVSFKGTKKLNQSVDHILKIGYDKCFLRTKRMFKGDQKFSRLLEDVEKSHKVAKNELTHASITQFENDCKWKVECQGEEYCVFHLQSHCSCKILCKECQICMHEYACSCEAFVKTQTMCAHIHKVHCFRNNIVEELHVEQEEKVDSANTVVTFTGNQEVICGNETETEITILSENQLESLSFADVLQLQAAAGLFKQASDQDETKIVSITDADTQKILYDTSMTGSIIFQLDPN